jgi:predicted small metal-binding protein
MANQSDTKTKPNTPGTNPNTTSSAGGINPSAPTTGTEGWGNTRDEREALGPTDPYATAAGQMKGNPGDQMREAADRASAAAPSANSPSTERDRQPLGKDQADRSTKGTTSFAMNTSHGGEDRTFRCADIGNADCRWETAGLTDDEVILNVYEHGKENHGWKDWSDAMRSKIKNAITHRDAA